MRCAQATEVEMAARWRNRPTIATYRCSVMLAAYNKATQEQHQFRIEAFSGICLEEITVVCEGEVDRWGYCCDGVC